MNIELLLNRFRRDREYRELFAELDSLPRRDGTYRAISVGGLSEGASELFRLLSTRDLTAAGRSVLLIFPDDKTAEREAVYLTSSGAQAMFFPTRDLNFNNMTSSHDVEHRRISVLSELLDGERVVICASAGAILQSTMPPEVLRDGSITLEPGGVVDIAKLAQSLVHAGYRRVEIVEGPGQFAVRGGIADIYSPSGEPYRIELFGDEIDRLCTFDPMTQRCVAMCDKSITLPPARELLQSSGTRELLSAAVGRQLKRTDADNERTRRILSEELSAIDGGVELNFADKYIPLIYPEAPSLADIFEGDVICVSPSECATRAAAEYTLLWQSIEDMSEHGEIPRMRGMSYGYMKEWDSVSSLLKRSHSILIDNIRRSYDDISIGAEFDFETRHVSPYASRRELFFEDVKTYVERGWCVFVLCASENESEALCAELVGDGITAARAESAEITYEGDSGCVFVTVGSMSGGFESRRTKTALLDYSSDDRGRRAALPLRRAKKKKKTESIMSYADLEVGDLVVHAAYGIGQYMGVQTLSIAGVTRDYITVKYAGTDQLFLPVDQLELVSKYIGGGSENGSVRLSKMGGADWTRAKTRARAATREMAHELIQLYAARRRADGIAFAEDDDMCREFAASFDYEETEGQLAAIEDVRHDMEEGHPMDRLICGDVGYGKTEVALRAAFKAVMGGYQVAILVPTTILAYQHYKTFKNRMRHFPVNIDMVSRFRSASEQQAALRRLRRGETDIIIGTHRLISSDVEFSKLGLVIIDEEQRFGVAQKEKLKKSAIGADILTLTATPIPRTLNMAMGGIVDMSLLEEAPGVRAPVQTYVLEYDEMIILEAIRRELRRSGQVFYLYNRVEGIYNVAGRISKAIPDASVAVAHGKMDKEELEEIWEKLVSGEIDILVCTTIIETGVDVPNANTLIIENADMYGLSQLHQIRGRVGRSERRAYAYFTYRQNKNLSEIAERRLSAIKEYAEFGAGFRIALRDLEIRGAGNLLGSQQHGHMEAVGYDLYMKLLSEAVLEEQGNVQEKKNECVVDIKADAYLSQTYIPNAPQRMELYKKIAGIACDADYDDMLDELCDRFGEPSAAAVDLCRIALIRALAADAGFIKVTERDGTVSLICRKLDPQAAAETARRFPDSRIRATLGSEPTLTCRLPKKERNTEFILSLLRAYGDYSKSQSK